MNLQKKTILIDGDSLNFADIRHVIHHNFPVKLSKIAARNIKQGRKVVEDTIKSGEVVYGINTGFGLLSNVTISADKIKQLQLNLIRSHACGTGEPLSDVTVKTAMLLLANGLSKGTSGCRQTVIDTLIAMVNKGVYPVVPSQGSLGASGDLIPLSHTALVLVGEGESVYKGKRQPGRSAMKKAGIPVITLEAKEGLCLINGTYYMAALGSIVCIRAESLAKMADVAASMTLEVTMGTKVSARREVHELKPHKGQKESARNIEKIVKGSKIIASHEDCERVQDAYSIRCTPQVHGAARDAIDYCRRTVATEINSATDNPLIIGEEIVSAGNFHGEALAISLDAFGIAVTNLGNIAERRVERLVNPNLSGHPAFLTPDPGLNSGYMMPSYLVAALTLENRGLSTPASVESVPTSANKEDYISNGMWSARKALRILENAEKIIATEILLAAQAKEFLTNLKLGKGSDAAYHAIRSKIPKLHKDRFLQKEILKVTEMVEKGEILAAVETATGKLA